MLSLVVVHLLQSIADTGSIIRQTLAQPFARHWLSHSPDTGSAKKLLAYAVSMQFFSATPAAWGLILYYNDSIVI